MGIKDVQITSRNTEGFVHELALIQEVNKESVDWVFRNSTSLGLVLCKVYDIQDEGLRRCRDYEQLVNTKEWMEIIAEHGKILSLIITSQYLFNLVLASETAFQVLLKSAYAIKKVFENSTATNNIIKSETMLKAVLACETSRKALFATSSAINSLAKNELAWEIIQDLMENDSLIFEEIVNTETAVNGIMSNSYSMEKIAESAILMQKIVDSAAAREALYNNYKTTQYVLASNDTALAIMQSSRQYEVVSGYDAGVTTATKILYSGKAFVLEIWGTTYNSWELFHGNYITGSKVINLRLNSPEKIKVNRFASSVATGTSGINTSMITSYHAIFKI